MKTLIAVSALALLAGGCSTFLPVPQTKIKVDINNTKFTWACPKQFAATNISAEVDTNGVARFSVGSVNSVNDPAVIDKSYSGQALVIKEMGVAVVEGIKAGK